MSSKGQGLSLNTIVIAAIVLVVLVILVGITTGYFGSWKDKFSTISDTSCKGQGGEEKTTCAETEKEVYAAETSEGKKCCAKKTCEDLNGLCCLTGSRLIAAGAWSCTNNCCSK